jgi:alkylhydroperoxidase family enzyme
VERAEATERQAELLDALGPAGDLNIFRTMAQHPKLMRSWLPFGGRLLQGSSLPAADRELVILRVAAACGSDYEWGQHVAIARDVGLSDDRIRAAGLDGVEPVDGLSAWDAAVLRATDELVVDHCLSDQSWAALSERYDTQQLLEVAMLAGHYAMLAGVLRSAGVRAEGPLPPVGQVEQPGDIEPTGER